jgi:hypothetical protein
MAARRPFTTLLSCLLSAGLLLAAGGTASAESTPTWRVSPVLSGLNGPRGLAFDNSGSLYVAEAGQFFPIPADPPQWGVSQTGMVDKFRLGPGGPNKVWSTPFDSLHDTFIAGPTGEVLGPAGLSNADGHVLAIVSESRDGVHMVSPGLVIPQIGHLFSLNRGNGKPTDQGDIGDQEYAWAAQHSDLWEEFPDSNPTDVLVTKDGGGSRTFVIDAGANTVSEVMRDGTNRVIAFIPNDRLRDSTPTCAAQGPDGALYIGTLDLVDNLTFGPGQSHVYRVDPDTDEDFLTAAHVWASGLTTIYGCTFDGAGNFWATEMFQPNQAGPPGDLVRIPFEDPTAIQHIGGTPFPGGIKQGPDGSMYVAVNSPITAPGAGGVVKVSPA